MTSSRIASLALAFVVSLVPALASAQHEPPRVERPAVERHAVASTHASVRPHLTEQDEQLRPPSAGEWVLPIGAIVLGAGAFVTGAVFTVGALLGLALVGVSSLDGRGDEQAARDLGIATGLGLAGMVLGGVLVGVGGASVASLRDRDRQTRGPNLRAVGIAPRADGLEVTVVGTF